MFGGMCQLLPPLSDPWPSQAPRVLAGWTGTAQCVGSRPCLAPLRESISRAVRSLTHADRGGQREAEGVAPTGSPTIRANSMHYHDQPPSLTQSSPLSTSVCLHPLVSLTVIVHLRLSAYNRSTLCIAVTVTAKP